MERTRWGQWRIQSFLGASLFTKTRRFGFKKNWKLEVKLLFWNTFGIYSLKLDLFGLHGCMQWRRHMYPREFKWTHSPSNIYIFYRYLNPPKKYWTTTKRFLNTLEFFFEPPYLPKIKFYRYLNPSKNIYIVKFFNEPLGKNSWSRHWVHDELLECQNSSILFLGLEKSFEP